MMQIKHLRVILIFCLAILCVTAQAQQKGISMQNIADVKVDELSDEQILEFWTKYKNSGLGISQLEANAAQRNMSPQEIQKLKERIEKLEKQSDTQIDIGGFGRETEEKKDEKEERVAKAFKGMEQKIFGAELFNNKNLTFEPNLKIATPSNYLIGTDDELIVDIYGFSEATYKLKVTPEGFIRIPMLGPVQVVGNTIEQARKKITSQLSAIYSGISTGQTSVNVTLGNIRSIKVNILGEVSLPGTYTLPSLATVFNALYASGGPGKNGSFRNIKVIRSGKVIATVDVYEFLMKGDAKGNVRLQDQDVIKVSPYEVRVELKGEVKRPGYYEVAHDESLEDVLSFSGGFTDVAYKDRIKVFRNTGREKSVADVPSDMFMMFTPQTGDVYEIGRVLERFSNRVEIRGAVFRPGIFALQEGLTVSGLIKKAEGLTEDAFMSRAIIYRLKEDNSAEVISFDVKEVMNGKDIPLKREDVIEINSKLDLKENYTLTIQGEVLTPGVYPFAENARVEDLIIIAGGLKDNASLKKVEIARRVKTPEGTNAPAFTEIFTYQITEDLKTNSGFMLMPFDIVTIYTLPNYMPQRNILLEGEVLYPGQYTIGKQRERISDVIKRAGGVTEFGFTEGAVLIRTKKLSAADEVIRKQKLEALQKQTKDTTRTKEMADKDELTSIVGIDLDKIMKKPGSKYDLVLEDGDMIRIPRVMQTIRVSGEVLYPVRIRYNKGKGFKKYVSGAGGYSQRAYRRGAYVVYANGSAEGTSKFLFFNIHPRIKPGAEIIIPPKEERKKLSGVEIVSISASITTVAVLIVTLFR